MHHLSPASISLRLLGTRMEMCTYRRTKINFLKSHFKKVTGIKSNHHFMFSAGRPGIVTMKLFCDSPTTEQQLTVTPCPLQMPPVLVTKGLENKRKKYLFNEIRQFCRDETKDIVCPKPEPPLQPTTDDVPADELSAETTILKLLKNQQNHKQSGTEPAIY